MPEKVSMSAPRRRVREILVELLGGQCDSCGKKERLTIDHIIPIALGGSDSVTNMHLLCTGCHRKKNGNEIADILTKIKGIQIKQDPMAVYEDIIQRLIQLRAEIDQAISNWKSEIERVENRQGISLSTSQTIRRQAGRHKIATAEMYNTAETMLAENKSVRDIYAVFIANGYKGSERTVRNLIVEIQRNQILNSSKTSKEQVINTNRLANEKISALLDKKEIILS